MNGAIRETSAALNRLMRTLAKESVSVSSTFEVERPDTKPAKRLAVLRIPNRRGGASGFVFKPAMVGNVDTVVARAAGYLHIRDPRLINDACVSPGEALAQSCVLASPSSDAAFTAVAIEPSKSDPTKRYLYTQVGDVTHLKADEDVWMAWAKTAHWAPGTELSAKVVYGDAVTGFRVTVGNPPTVTPERFKETLIGQGSGGCAYRPALPCPGRPLPDTPVVSKLTASSTDIEELKRVKAVDPHHTFTVQLFQHCPYNKPLPATSRDCAPLRRRVGRSNLYNLVLEDGGKSLRETLSGVTSAHGVAQMLLSLRNLVSAVDKLRRQAFVHADIKPMNIVMPVSRRRAATHHVAKLIDFGLSFRVAASGNPMRDWHLFSNWPPREANTGFYMYYPPELTCQHAVARRVPVTVDALAEVMVQYAQAVRRRNGLPWNTAQAVQTATVLAAEYNKAFLSTTEDKDVDALRRKWALGIDTFSAGMVLWEVARTLGRVTATGHHRPLAVAVDGARRVAEAMSNPLWTKRVSPLAAVRMYDALVVEDVRGWLKETA